MFTLQAGVLREHTHVLSLFNQCAIPADFKLFIEGGSSVFRYRDEGGGTAMGMQD